MVQEREHYEKPGNICVVGCGHWGKNLIRNFRTMGHLKAVCDSNTESLTAIASQYPGISTYRTLAEALAHPELDSFVLASPAEQHHRMALAAIQAGKDVFVEKPLALDAEDGLEMGRAARERGVMLMVGHLLRYHPAILKIQELVAAGTLGHLDYIYSNRLSMGKIRQEENALWSFAPHDISVVLALVGQRS